MIKRDVFHIRLKDVEIQTERLMDCTLRTRPIAIISSDNPNGSIMFLSSEAKEEGLSIGMKVSMVRKMNHRIQLLPYNHSLYNHIHYYIYRSVSLFTPVVEPQGIGEFFLDMDGMRSLRGNMKNTGLSIINRIENQTSLSGIVGISTNKLVSRIVTAVIPDSIYKVEKGEEANFLSPLRPSILPIVQKKSIHRLLRFLFIKKIGQIQSMADNKDEFHLLFGIHAKLLYNESKGKDTNPVRIKRLKDHLIEHTVLPKDTNDRDMLYAIIRDIADKISFQLRKRQQIAENIKLEICYTDGYKHSRVGKIENIDDISIFNICKRLFHSANKRRNRIRMILVDLWRFHPYFIQENLFDISQGHNISLSRAIDKIRDKHGVESLQTANVFQFLRLK